MRQSSDAQSASSILQMSEDYLDNLHDYMGDLKLRNPEKKDWIYKNLQAANFFLFWALLYEYLMYLRPQKVHGKRKCLFQTYGYRLSVKEVRVLREKIITLSPHYLKGITAKLIGLNSASRAFNFLAKSLNYPDFFRKILRLE